MARITVIDEVWPRAGMAEAYRDTYLATYAPVARQRGMTLEGVRLTPPLLLKNGGNRIAFVWSLPDATAFWAMRLSEDDGEEPWWVRGADMAHRQRRTFHTDFQRTADGDR